MSEPQFLITLQGPTAEGNILLESWWIPESTYVELRQGIAAHEHEPVATTLTDADARVISQRFAGDA